MIKNLLAYFAKKSHDVRTQLLLASIYGLVSLYGVTGAFAIILKARKLTNAKPRNRVTVRSTKGPTQ